MRILLFFFLFLVETSFLFAQRMEYGIFSVSLPKAPGDNYFVSLKDGPFLNDSDFKRNPTVFLKGNDYGAISPLYREVCDLVRENVVDKYKTNAHLSVYPFFDQNGRMRDIIFIIRPDEWEYFPACLLEKLYKKFLDRIPSYPIAKMIQDHLEKISYPYRSNPYRSNPYKSNPNEYVPNNYRPDGYTAFRIAVYLDYGE